MNWVKKRVLFFYHSSTPPCLFIFSSVNTHLTAPFEHTHTHTHTHTQTHTHPHTQHHNHTHTHTHTHTSVDGHPQLPHSSGLSSHNLTLLTHAHADTQTRR